jgi:hypothetical protein
VISASSKMSTPPLANSPQDPRYRRELKGADGFVTRSRLQLSQWGCILNRRNDGQDSGREQRLRCLIPEQSPENVKPSVEGSSRDARPAGLSAITRRSPASSRGRIAAVPPSRPVRRPVRAAHGRIRPFDAPEGRRCRSRTGARDRRGLGDGLEHRGDQGALTIRSAATSYLTMDEDVAVRKRPAAYEIVAFIHFTEDYLRQVARGARRFAVNSRNPLGYPCFLRRIKLIALNGNDIGRHVSSCFTSDAALARAFVEPIATSHA